jgi:hypothetical protein
MPNTTPNITKIPSARVVLVEEKTGLIGALTGVDLTTQVTGVLPVANGGTGLTVRPTVVTKTADFTLADDEGWVINNKSGSTCTVTLPAASAWPGRVVTFKNLQTQTLVSASSIWPKRSRRFKTNC